MKYLGAASFAAACLLSSAVFAQTQVTVLSINREDPSWGKIYTDAVAEYNAAHPDVKVTIDFMEDEAFKQKLPTLLQSDAAPDVFYTWGGGTLREQAKQGLLRDITSVVDEGWKSEYSATAFQSVSADGKIYGAPENVGAVVLWYNKKLAADAGIAPDQIKTWDDFIAAAAKAKAAGITPIVVGGQDKWPLHFYYASIALRVLGAEGIKASAAGQNGGFDTPEWITVGKEFQKLTSIEPFEPGFMSVKYDQAAGMWGSGKAVFHLMGEWEQGAQRGSAANGGLSDDELGVLAFPAVTGGKGDPSEVVGGAGGFLLSRKASDQAVDFLRYFLSPAVQTKAAEVGAYIPTATPALTHVKNPIVRQIADLTSAAKAHQLFLDQDLGPNLGGVINDISAELATDDLTPEAAAAQLEEARQSE